MESVLRFLQAKDLDRPEWNLFSCDLQDCWRSASSFWSVDYWP